MPVVSAAKEVDGDNPAPLTNLSMRVSWWECSEVQPDVAVNTDVVGDWIDSCNRLQRVVLWL